MNATEQLPAPAEVVLLVRGRFDSLNQLDELTGSSAFRRAIENYAAGKRKKVNRRFFAKVLALIDGDFDYRAREARVDYYRELVERRGWIFSPPKETEDHDEATSEPRIEAEVACPPR